MDPITSFKTLSDSIIAELGEMKAEVLFREVGAEIRDSIKRGSPVSLIDKLYLLHKITNNRFLALNG